jgi:probable rRNA maturation factor
MEPLDRRASAAPDSFCQVELSDTQSHSDATPEELVRLAQRTLAREGHNRGSVSIALVDDAAIHELNRRHLGHDFPTDVLSFLLSEAEEEFSGAVVISAETAVRLAKEAGVAPLNELALYLVHGLLHLCGYDDQNVAAQARMRAREHEILAAEGLTNPFPLVAGALVQGER